MVVAHGSANGTEHEMSDIKVNAEAVRGMRDALRMQIPGLSQGHVPNETLSVFLSLLSEAVTLRIVTEVKRLKGEDMVKADVVPLMDRLTRELSEVISKIVKEHVPDATIYFEYKEPD